MTRSHRRLSLALTLALLATPVLSTGCFGQFQIVRNLYGFNRTVSQDRFVRWAVFLAMNIAPVYPVGAVMDAFIANPVEFWSGDNPVKGSKRWLGGQAQLTPLPEGPVMELAGAGPGGGALYVELAPDALLAWDERGELLARITDVGGRATVVGGKLFEPGSTAR